MTATRCSSPKQDGSPCRAFAVPGSDVCRWHDQSPEGRAKHIAASVKGGLTKAYGALASVGPLADDPKVAGLDLETAEGLRGLLGVTLAALARLPFDNRCAHAISALATAQRNTIETAGIEARLGALEKAQQSLT